MSAPPKFSLAVQYATEAENLPIRPQFRRWIKSSLQREAQIVLRVVDENEGRELNKNFRGKDYATNVLTFVYDDSDVLSGDVVVCAPVVEREACDQQKTLHAHYAHLVIHAALHLQGYDHENEQDADTMESLETAIMMKLGYADPYRVVTV
jgi:probable rRNA maturation factor